MKVEFIPVLFLIARDAKDSSLEGLEQVGDYNVQYRAKDVPNDILLKEVKYHIHSAVSVNEIPYSLNGGYVLKIDGKTVLDPQCCSELSDIVFWKYLLLHKKWTYSNAHPAPLVEYTKNSFIFDCDDDVEDFFPPTPLRFSVDKNAMLAAFEQAMQELNILAEKLKEIETEVDYDFSECPIEELLIFKNDEIDESSLGKYQNVLKVKNFNKNTLWQQFIEERIKDTNND